MQIHSTVTFGLRGSHLWSTDLHITTLYSSWAQILTLVSNESHKYCQKQKKAEGKEWKEEEEERWSSNDKRLHLSQRRGEKWEAECREKECELGKLSQSSGWTSLKSCSLVLKQERKSARRNVAVQPKTLEIFEELDPKPNFNSNTGLLPEKSQSLMSTSPLLAFSQALSFHPFSEAIPSLSCLLPWSFHLCDTFFYR